MLQFLSLLEILEELFKFSVLLISFMNFEPLASSWPLWHDKTNLHEKANNKVWIWQAFWFLRNRSTLSLSSLCPTYLPSEGDLVRYFSNLEIPFINEDLFSWNWPNGSREEDFWNTQSLFYSFLLTGISLFKWIWPFDLTIHLNKLESHFPKDALC